ncbi:carbohydrate kinase [uncultured Paraglaciecola sp.]|uniref:carbohydrate kinase family protein n=1 Tax=uncultured Paraglaciecola sp. TaxID=1765024 RepID=UPI0030DBF44D
MNKPFNIIGVGEVLWDIFPDGSRFGGAPANVACAISGLSRKTAKVTMVSAVGKDILGIKAIDSLAQFNVDVSQIQSTTFPTGTVTVNLNESLHATYQIAENSAWDNISWNDSLDTLALSADAICFGSLAQRTQCSRETIQTLVAALPDSALKVFDVNLRAPFYSNEIIIQSLELANVLKLNEEELPIIADILGISGETNELLQSITKQFKLNSIALTQGSKGAVLIHNQEQVEVPIVPTTVVDTVGAGDSFTAAFTLGLLQQNSLIEIAHFATKVASYVCSQQGGTPQLTHLTQP